MLSLEKTKTPRERAWDYALTARMNVLYYQRLIWHWKWIDVIARIVPAVTSSSVVVLLLLAKAPSVVPWLAGFGALVGVLSVVLKVTETARALVGLLAEYTAHMAVFERIFYGGECSPEEVNAAIAKFEETDARAANDDPTPSERLLEKARLATLSEIGAPS